MSTKDQLAALKSELGELHKLLVIVEERNTVLPIEHDLILDKLRRCYEQALALKGIAVTSAPIVETPVIEKKDEPADILEFAEESHKTNEKTVVPLMEETESNNLVHEDIAEEEPIISSHHTQPSSPKNANAGTIIDQYLGQKESLNDAFSKNPKQKDLVTRLQTKPIKSIASSIGINEKFQFTKNLFKGDAALYAKTIDALDNASTFNDAYLYLTDHFNWDMEEDSVMQILDLVRRKFITLKNE